jgi:hypothetical protein
MISGLLAVIACASAPPIDVAFTARYYFQGAMKSFFQIYVCRHDGSGRRQVTFENDHVERVFWLDQNQISFTLPGPVRHTPTAWSRDLAIYSVNIETGRKRLLKLFKDVAYRRDDQHLEIFGPTPKVFKITSNGVIRINKLPPDPPEYFGAIPGKEDPDPVTNLVQRHFRLRHSKGEQNFDWKIKPYDMGYSGTKIAVQAQRQGEKFQLFLKGDTVEEIRRGSDRATYFITGVQYKRIESPSFVYRWSDSEVEPKLIVSNIGMVQFDTRRDFWFGHEIRTRQLKPLKDGRMVDVGALYSGNWKTGQRWTIANGLVLAYGATLRPKA